MHMSAYGYLECVSIHLHYIDSGGNLDSSVTVGCGYHTALQVIYLGSGVVPFNVDEAIAATDIDCSHIQVRTDFLDIRYIDVANTAKL